MAYTAWSVVFGEQPTAAKWNQLGANDAGFKDGTNIDNNAILARHLSKSDIQSNEQAWQTPTLQNSWVAYDVASYPTAQYYKDSLGIVHLRGLIKSGGTTSIIFTLPSGYRPEFGQSHFPVATNSVTGVIRVERSTGNVVGSGGISATWLDLAGINFPARS